MILCMQIADSLAVRHCKYPIHASGYATNKNEHFQSTTRRSFADPSTLPKLNMRNLTEKEPNFKSQVNSRSSSLASGFVMNATLFDGTGWVTHKSLHSDMVRSEYRNRFNREITFHNICAPLNSGILKKKEVVYDKL